MTVTFSKGGAQRTDNIDVNLLNPCHLSILISASSIAPITYNTRSGLQREDFPRFYSNETDNFCGYWEMSIANSDSSEADRTVFNLRKSNPSYLEIKTYESSHAGIHNLLLIGF